MRFKSLFLVLMTAPALAAAQEAQPRTVEVDLSSFAFAPSTLQLHAGEAITLHLVNTGNGGHNFSAPQFFAAATVAPEDAAKVTHGAVEVRGHQSVDVHLTVPAAGHYELRCTHPLHASFGMRGVIEVG